MNVEYNQLGGLLKLAVSACSRVCVLDVCIVVIVCVDVYACVCFCIHVYVYACVHWMCD